MPGRLGRLSSSWAVLIWARVLLGQRRSRCRSGERRGEEERGKKERPKGGTSQCGDSLGYNHDFGERPARLYLEERGRAASETTGEAGGGLRAAAMGSTYSREAGSAALKCAAAQG